jgi:hypothetical protein
MIADGSIAAKYFIGITTEAIANGEDGKVTTFGKIRGLNTAAYAEGQTLWVSATTAGAFVTTRPVAPNLDLEVAIVINSSVNNGTIFVRSNIGHYLGTAHDVNITSVSENDLLVYKTNRWVNTKSIGDLSAANVTLSGYLRGPATFVIDPAAYGDETGLVQILGDLRVDGTTTTINSTTISVSDKNITLAKDAATAGDANGAGLTIAGANATLTYLSATDDFTFNKNVNASRFVGPLTGDVTGTISTLSNHDTDDLAEGLANLYFTTARARAAFSAGTGVSIASGVISIGQSVGTTDDVTFGIVTASLSGNATTASALANARNIALDGSVTGNADFDGSGNITITTTTNHNHDDRYYTETESDSRFVNVSGDTMTGDLSISNAQPKLRLKETDTSNLDKEILVSGGAFYVRNLNDDNTAGTNILTIDNSGNLTAAGTLTASGYNKTNWDAAYNAKINSGYFNSNNGDLVLTRQDDSTLEINFDDRYVIANTENFKSNTYSVNSGTGTQRYLLLTTSGQVDQFFHITINRAYDYGDNDQTKQQIIYQRRNSGKNLRWRLDGDTTATQQVFIEIYAKANGDDEVWLVCTDFAKPQVYVEHDGFFWNGLTTADTPTGTLIKTTELTASNKPNWEEQVGLVRTTDLYSDNTYLRGSTFVLSTNGSSYDTLVYRDGTNPHVLYAGGGTSTQWNTAYTYSQVGHLPLTGGTLSGALTSGRLTLTNNVSTGGFTSFDDYQILLYESSTGFTQSYGIGIEGDTMMFNSDNRYRFYVDNVVKATIESTGSLTLTGGITASGYNNTNWDTAYGWGNHAGLYLPLAGKAADSELLDGIDSSRIVFGSGANKSQAFDGGDINSAIASGFYDGFDMVGAPIASTYHHLIHARHNNTANNYAMQIAGDFFADTLYYRQITNNVASAWRTIIHSGNIGSQSVNYATSAGTAANAALLDSIDSSQFLRSDESDTMTGSLTINASGVGLTATSSQNTGLIVDGGTNSGIIADFRYGATKAVINTSGGGYFLGNVGIGTTSLGARLHVATPDPATNFNVIDFRNPSYGIYAKSNSVPARGNTLEFTATDYNSGGTVLTRDVLTLRPEGNVGIGTTSPSEKLDVIGGGLAAGNGTIRTGITYSSIGLIGTFSNHDLGVITNGTQRMIIGSDGAMGFNYPTLGVRSFMFRALSGRPLAVEIADVNGIHSVYVRPDISGTNLITSNYLSGGVYRPLTLSGRENVGDLFLATSGNIGIGTTSPEQKLHVAGGLAYFAQNAGSGSAFRWGTFGTAVSPDTMLCMNQLWNGAGWTILSSSVGTTYLNLGSGVASPDISFGTGPANTAATTKVVIKNNGNVGIGVTSPAQKLEVAGNIVTDNLYFQLNGNINKIGSGSTLKIINSNAITEMFVNGSGNLGIGIQNNTALAKVHVGGTFTGGYTSDASVGPMLVHNSSTDTSTFGIKVKLDAGTFGAAIAFWQGSTLRGYIGISSGGTSYSTSSDYRLKENVVTLENATEKVMQLKPKRFNFIEGDGTIVDGFLAHEVQEVIPAAVQGEKDAIDNQGTPIYQGIDHSKLVPLLTASLQEALKRIETLEQKINQLTNNL